MPRLSIYLPDELVDRAKLIDAEANMSQLVQTALRRMLGEPARPAYASAPCDAKEAFAAARKAWRAGADEEYQRGYRDALRRIPDLPWRAVDEAAQVDFQFRRWLDGWRNTIADPNAPHFGSHAPEWFWKLAEDLGNLVDPIGHDKTSFRPSTAYERGYRDALKAVYHSVERASADGDPADVADPDAACGEGELEGGDGPDT